MESINFEQLKAASQGKRHDEKWEVYKNVLQRLYHLSIPKIRSIMIEKLEFRAENTHYKFRFKKWGWKKNIPAKKKAAILDSLETRPGGYRNTTVRFKGRNVDGRRLLRAAKDDHSTEITLFTPEGSVHSPIFHMFPVNPFFGNRGGFINWHIPLRVLGLDLPDRTAPPSPTASVTMPSDIEMANMSEGGTPPPAIFKAVEFRAANKRTQLLLTGQIGNLIKSLDPIETRSFSTWLYDFWFFMFKTAKHWGRGPLKWTAHELWSNSPICVQESTFSNPTRANVPLRLLADEDTDHTESLKPTALCGMCHHWPHYIDWPDSDSESDLSEEAFKSPVEERIKESLARNDFSRVNASNVPVNISRFAEAIVKVPNELFKEALIFAIIGRNPDLVAELLRRAYRSNESISSIFPLHLATTYLDGSNACCHILRLLYHYDSEKLELSASDVNAFGHTVLDNLMVTILRNHTTVSPDQLGPKLRAAKAFPGEEVDICGRWDADSPCYGALLHKGLSSIPSDWKHKFCHTAVQAVSHCILEIGAQQGFALLKLSGLFIRHCVSCGMQLRLGPLHSVVFTAFLLAEKGTAEEDLFGMVCVLLSHTVAVSDGTGPEELRGYITSNHISLDLLLDGTSDNSCTHQLLSPFKFAKELNKSRAHRWSPKARVGWKCFSRVLECIEAQYNPGSRKAQAPDPENSPPSNIFKSMSPSDWSDPFAMPNMFELFDAPNAVDSFDMSNLQDSLHGFNENSSSFHQDEELDLDTKVFFAWEDNLGYKRACSHAIEFPYGKLYGWRAFGSDRRLGHLWASCQCELVTYRRKTEEDAWQSKYLDMDILLTFLDTGDPAVLPFVANGMMEDYCACGRFDGLHPFRELDICREVFSDADFVTIVFDFEDLGY